MQTLLDPSVHDAFLFGILSACSLPLGCLTALWWQPSDKAIAFLMAFGGGALLAALTIDLVGNSLAMGEFYPLAAGCITGGLIFIGLNRIINDFGGFVRKASTQMYHLRHTEHLKFRKLFSGLKRVDVFTDLADEDFKLLAQSIYNWDVTKDTLIFSKSEPCDELYIIASGQIELLDPDEKVESLFLNTNDDLGWLAFVTGTPYRFTAKALEDSTLWVLPKTAFFKLLTRAPGLAAATQRWIHSDKVRRYLTRHHQLSAKTLKTWRKQATRQIHHNQSYVGAVAIQHNAEAFKQKAGFIQGFHLFNDLPDFELDTIGEHLVYKHYVSGNTFFHKGEAADHMFMIESGKVSVIDALGRFSHSIELISGDAFGYDAFMTGGRYTMSTMALEPTDVWVLRKRDFHYLLKILPEFKQRFLEHLQKGAVEEYLMTRQQLSNENATLWLGRAIKDLQVDKTPLPVMALHADIKHHQGAALGIWLGLMLDSIPEALVIGASLIQSTLGFSLLAGLFLSNYPEALSSSVGMRRQGMRIPLILTMWCALMLTTGILSALGNIYFNGVSHATFAFTQGIAAGAMLTMIAQTMLPEAYFKGGEIIGFSTLLGFLAAIFFKTLE